MPFLTIVAKKSDSFDSHIKCLNYMAGKLEEIRQSDSPVAYLLTLENDMVDYQEELGMQPNTYRDNSEESPDNRFTTLFVKFYE